LFSDDYARRLEGAQKSSFLKNGHLLSIDPAALRVAGLTPVSWIHGVSADEVPIGDAVFLQGAVFFQQLPNFRFIYAQVQVLFQTAVPVPPPESLFTGSVGLKALTLLVVLEVLVVLPHGFQDVLQGLLLVVS